MSATTELTFDECMQLLRTARSVGQSVPHRWGPQIIQVNYVVHDGDIALRTGPVQRPRHLWEELRPRLRGRPHRRGGLRNAEGPDHSVRAFDW